MKKFILYAGLAIVLIGCKTTSSENKTFQLKNSKISDPSIYASTITEAELKEMLFKYASDEFEGRDTGSKGQKMAVEFLKNQYKSMAIKTPLKGDDYFQEVELEEQKIADASLSVNGKSFESFTDQLVLRTSDNFDLSTTEIVYVGYGIDSEAYSDYNNIDVKGKIVLAKAGEPKDDRGNYVTSGNTEYPKWTKGRQAMSSKRMAAIDNGAKGLIYLDDSAFSEYAPYYKKMAFSGITGRLSLVNGNEAFMLLVTNKLAQALYNNILNEDKTKTINTELHISINKKSTPILSENVLAYIEGSEKPEEIVVVSAHLDHVGMKDGKVYNGADDDGSGTVAVLEIAEAFKEAQNVGYGPKRTVLFLHVTGEEKGLLGSSHYTDLEPIFPLENTVANLNIDMIGRTDPKRTEGDRNYLYLIGSDKLSSELHNISEEVNSKYCNIEFDYKYNDDNDPNRFYYRSDHYNFAKNNIPVIFYFNGTHADYHQPSDTPDKIEYDLLQNRTRLIFHTAWELANRDNRIVVDKLVE